MAKSTSTQPALDADLVRYAQDYAREVTGTPPTRQTGVLGAAGRGGVRGAFGLLGEVAKAAQANPMSAGMDFALSMGGAPTNPIGQTGENLANRIAPAPQGGLPRLVEAGTAGMVGGAPFGPLGAVSGAAGGLSAEGAAMAGGGPVAQLLAGLVGGMVPGVGARIVAGRGPLGAASAFERSARRDQTTAAEVLRRPADPETMGMARTGRPGADLTQRVAAAGGKPADVVGQAAQDRLTQYESAVQRSRTAEADRIVRARAQERSLVDFSREQVKSRQRGAEQAGRAQERALKETAKATEAAAQRSAAGDQIAAHYERAVGTRHRTLLQYEKMAEQDLRDTGRRTFGQLEQTVREVPPTEGLLEAFNNSIVARTFERYFPSVKQPNAFAELQKTYQALGTMVRAAAKNGGALPDGTLMTDIRQAREQLSRALDEAVPGFAEANRLYRAKATVLEALDDGYLAGRSGKPADVADELQRLAAIDPDAVQAHLVGQRLSFLDQLREMPSSRAASERFLNPGSDMAARIRLAFPDETSYQQFSSAVQGAAGQRGASGIAMERSLAGLRDQLRQQVDALATSGTRQRAQIREVAAEEVRGIRQAGQAERTALPTDDLPLMRSVVAESRNLPAQANTESTRALADIGANRFAPARRDLLLTWIRNKRLSPAVRQRLARVLTLKGAEFEQEAEQLLRDLGVLNAMLPRAAAAGFVAGADATGTRRE